MSNKLRAANRLLCSGHITRAQHDRTISRIINREISRRSGADIEIACRTADSDDAPDIRIACRTAAKGSR